MPSISQWAVALAGPPAPVPMSPGGMLDMSRHGVMCSAIRQATTAVENRESARQQWAKEMALWRVALAWGFVFDVDDLVTALASSRRGRVQETTR